MLVLQISDLHLKADGKPAYAVADTASALQRTVNHINRMNPPPDVIIATGDIVDDGEPESYKAVRKLLLQLKSPLFLLPGNHDHKENLVSAFPEHEYLSERVDGRTCGFICYTVENYPVRLVALDTSDPGEHGGGVCQARLSWLDATLARKPAVPTLLFMHHPPFDSGIGHMDHEKFRGRDQLEELVRRHPQVERVLCGHIHRSISRRFGGTVANVCPGIGMQLVLDLSRDAPSCFVMEPSAVLVHYWHEQALLTHLSVVDDPPGQFGPDYPFFDVVSPV